MTVYRCAKCRKVYTDRLAAATDDTIRDDGKLCYECLMVELGDDPDAA